MEVIVKVKSSSSDSIYEVKLSNENGLLKFNCDCNARMSKKICHHRRNILEGDVSALIDESDVLKVKNFLDTLEKNKAIRFLKEYDKQIKEIDKEIKKMKELKTEINGLYYKSFCEGF